MYSTEAIRFEQNGRVFYVAAIPAGVLIDLAKVDVWHAEDPETGYQRSPSNTRKREIARYAMGNNAIMPLGGLLNARPLPPDAPLAYGKRLQFSEYRRTGAVAFGALTIPNEAAPLYIVDM